MFTSIFAIVVMAVVVGFSLYMANEIHDYMSKDNMIDELTVFN